MKLSVVIPVYNGALSITDLTDAVIREFGSDELEIILINDGSKDNSAEVCRNLANTKPEVKFISLRKNFGEHNAVMCGLNYATGEFVAIIDDDFQNPPEEIRKLMKEMEKGYDVVYSYYSKKEHAWFRNLGSKLNNMMANSLLNKPRDLYLSSFKMIHQSLIPELISYKGPFPYIDGLILRVTDNIGKALVVHRPRESGRSNYTLKKLVSLYLNMFLNFSIKPLRFFTILGFISFFLGLFFSVLFAIEKFMIPETPVGWASSVISVFVFSGVQLMFLGLIGEYLGKSYLDQNKTPQWVVKEEHL